MADDSGTKKLFVATNWKCGIRSPSDADDLVEAMNRMWSELDAGTKASVELSVHPPYVFVDRVRQKLDASISVGSQNVFDATFPNRGNTGATTPEMLVGLGCDRVLLGHSDRRNHLGETDDLIAAKAGASLAAGLGVVLTLGETKPQREAGEELAVLFEQLGTVADAIPNTVDTWKKVALAYEPVWAVGEGATPCDFAEAKRIHEALRGFVADRVSPEAASACTITYTGSVNPSNAGGYAEIRDVDGFVVGRAGLDASKLSSILTTLSETKAASSAASRFEL